MSVKKVVGFIIGAGAIAATIVTGGLAAPLTTKLLVVAGVLIASSVSSALLRGQPDLQNRQRRFLQQRTSPEEPFPLVYGKAKLGGILIDLRIDESSTDNRRLLAVVGFCQGSHPSAPNNGEIDGIEEIWFDDRLVWTEAGGVQAPFDIPLPFTDTDPLEAVNVYLGSTTQVVDPLLNTTFPTEWPSTSQLRGIAYAVLEMWRFDDIYPNGFPRITAVVRGRLVHDPRDATWKYSQNAALVVRDYLRDPIAGGNVPDAELDDAAFQTEANYCDESVDGQPRFELHGPVPTQQAVQQNLLEMLACCRMNLPYQGGVFRPSIRKTQAVSGIVLDESNIVEGSWSFVVPGSKDAPNIGRATFLYPEKNYEPDTVQWPEPGDPNPFLTEDSGLEARLEIDLPYLDNRQRALQLIATLVKEARQGIVAAVTAKDEALQLQFGDVVEVKHETPAWDLKPFWVLPLAILPDASVRLILLEYEETVYDDTLLAADPTIPDTGLPNPFTVAAPTNFALDGSVAVAQQNADGTYIPQILATWDRPEDPFVVEYEIQAKPQGSADWDAWGKFSPRDTTTPPDRSESFLLTPVEGGVTWDVRVRAINSLGVPSAWVQDSVAVADGPPKVEQITLSFTEAGVLRADVATTNAASIRFFFKTGSAPTAAEIQGGSILATDSDGHVEVLDAAGIAIGTTRYVGIAAYEAAGAGGAESPHRIASITRSSPGPSSAAPTPTIQNVVYTATQVTFDLAATIGVDGIGPLEVRYRAYLGGATPGAFGAWIAAPDTGIVIPRHAYELTLMEAQARDTGFTSPVVGELPFLWIVQPQNMVNIGTDPDAGDAVPGSELLPTDNIVLNPGFERGILSPWENASNGGATGWSARNSTARSGSWCVQFDSTGQTGTARLSANGPRLTPDGHAQAREGDVFFLEGWARIVGAGPGNTMRLEMVFRDAAGANVGTFTTFLTTPTQTYQRLELRGTAPAGAVYVTFSLLVLSSGNTETHLFDDIQAQRLHTAERIPDGAVITRTINDLAVEFAKLGQRAVAIENLFVGSFDNLIRNPGFEENGGSLDGWSSQAAGGGAWLFEGSITRSGAGALRYDTTGQTSGALFNARRGGGGTVQEQCFAATEGDEFYFEAFARAVAAGAANDFDVQILFYDESSGTALQTTISPAVTPTTAFQRASVQAIAPAGTAFVQFRLRVQNDGNDNDLVFDDAYARRMVTGSLVVDGTILAQHLTVATLDAIAADVGILTAGRLENAAGDAVILLSGTLPGGATSFLDFTAIGSSDPVLLFEDAIEIRGDGTAQFRGHVRVEGVHATGWGTPANYIELQELNVAHGVTLVAPTDVFAFADILVGGQGGLRLGGLTEDVIAIELLGVAITEQTAKSTSAAAAIHLRAAGDSGTGLTAMGANANLVAVRNQTTTRFILDADGDSHQDVGTAWTNFDAHDDVGILEALSIAVARPGDALRQDLNAWLIDRRAELEALGLVSFNGDGHHFVNMSRLSMLLVGAVRQIGARVEILEGRLLEEGGV